MLYSIYLLVFSYKCNFQIQIYFFLSSLYNLKQDKQRVIVIIKLKTKNEYCNDLLSEINPKNGAIVAKEILIIKLLIDRIVALFSDDIFILIRFFNRGVTNPLIV